MSAPQARILFAITLCALAAAWLAAGCAAIPDERQATFNIDFTIPGETGADKPKVILFFLDGLSSPVFNELLEAGRLPNLRKYFVDRGLLADSDTTNIPSITLANEVSLVTGVHPGHHNVVGNMWFDRNQLFFRNCEEFGQKNRLDNDYLTPTIFEHLSDAPTISLFFQAHRGATDWLENRLSAAPPYYLGWYELVDRISVWRFHMAMEEARVRHRFFDFTICYMLATDMNAYEHGISSPEYRHALEHADAQIGRILRDLEKAGRLDRTVLALTSDHGMVDVHNHMNIQTFVRDDLGLAVATQDLSDTKEYDLRLPYYNKFSCVLAGSGDRYWAFNLRKPRAAAAAGTGASTAADGGKPAEFEDWLIRPSEADLHAYPTRDGHGADLVAELLKKEAVDVVAWKTAPDTVRVATRAGVAEIVRKRGDATNLSGASDPAYSLKVLEGTDPLGYRDTAAAALLDGAMHAGREWLRATAATPHPDLVPQIVTYFDAPRAPDLAVFAALDWDFTDEGKLGGHGGVQAGEMHTIFLLAGPGVPHEHRTEPIRAVDILPTLMELLGRPVPTGLDGRSLLKK